MNNTIHLAASLQASADEVFDMYLDSRLHGEITGAPAKVSARAGADFSAFDGALTGKILQIVPKRLIVQSWRSSGWKAGDIDSTLVLTLWPEGRGKTRLELTQVNVPDGDFAGVSQGWEIYYWSPWRAYLENRREGRSRRVNSGRK